MSLASDSKMFLQNDCQLFDLIANMWKKVEKDQKVAMSTFFFSGSHVVKLDEKSRFVLPQSLRYGLIQDGKLEFTIGLGLGGCLAIYRRSVIQKIVKRFQEKQHVAKYQPFFTMFFSTLHETTCDQIGRTGIPSLLREAVGIQKEMVVAGVLNKIELWPKEVYDRNLQNLLQGHNKEMDLKKMMEEAFALLDEDAEEGQSKETAPLMKITEENFPLPSSPVKR